MKVETCSWDGWKRRKKDGPWSVVCLYLVLLMCASRAGGRTDSDAEDSVNVISVENLDALLRMRMVDVVRSVNHSDGAARSKRWISGRQRLPPPEVQAQVEPLCSRRGCVCTVVVDRFLNVTCVFESHEEVDLARDSLPSNLLHLRIDNAKQLRLLPYAFVAHPAFTEATFQRIATLHIQRDAFFNLSLSTFVLKIEDCSEVKLDERCYQNLRSPLDVTISGCAQVSMQSHVFSWLLHCNITSVPSLQIVANTFKGSKGAVRKDPTTNITFRNVTISTIPNATFPLSARLIMFQDCIIGTVQSEAFNAIEYATIHFEETVVERFQPRAFDPDTLVRELFLVGVRVQQVATQVLTSAVSTLTIQNCRIGEVTSGAFNMKAASVEISGNYISKLRRHAFFVTHWNRVAVNGNRFEVLEPESITIPFQRVTKVTRYEFEFSDNVVVAPSTATLAFIPTDAEVQVTLLHNKFDNPCHCHLPTWVEGLSSGRGQELYETSFCVVNDVLARCFNTEEGFMKMTNFTEGLCNNRDRLECEEARRTYHTEVFSDLDFEHTERRVLGVIFLGVVCSITIMLLILSAMWLRNKGFCGRAPSRLSVCGIFSRLFNTTTLVTTASISRINIHEYAEIQNHLNQCVNGQTILMVENTEGGDEEVVPCEDKATQTLPEELTQELLQSLREKLDDPDNYNEARDMIEHLYDLIKVEESCNNNSPSPRTSFLLDDDDDDAGDNLYDVIQPGRQPTGNSKSRNKRLKAEMVSTGTRAPSPDKLQPVQYQLARALRQVPALSSEYTEPRDRRSHEYSELPGPLMTAMPDVVGGYAQPMTINGRGKMTNRPLPERPDQPGTSDTVIIPTA